MDEESDAFYVVRKGDIVGIYKTLNDCQAQAGTSVCDPSVSVYKGNSLSKDAQDYLASCGLKNALYSIHAADIKEDIFGELAPCPFQQPDGPVPSKSKASKKASPQKKRSPEVESKSSMEAVGSVLTDQARKHLRVGESNVAQKSSNSLTCVLEFDGASKGNPGKAGAGAVLRTEDGSVVWRLREGVGIATNNVAEYRGIILGLKYALMKGFQRIRVQGDSKLVCMQIQNLWQARHKNMIELCKEAKELKDKFSSFQIDHVLRDLNSEADTQANLAVDLADGVVVEEGG